ncbi:hypothetical protein [Mucilaginibacter aquatilis]|uniref:Uncharacterized protein n=1 Tax=Mucilaginibacter aquatilis TaxID=1517760 RepID=A0A6I4I4A3_9SPHI|nr:hypothetical protein [Mucilaginibacter aquatilis]MVN89891.1 hypothetical protein [Mucilaginibacter aquatilis]
MIDSTIQNAINAALQAYTAYTPINAEELKTKLTAVFSAEEDFLSKADALDAVFNDYPQADALREVFFDLLMVNFFSADIDRLEEDYLDSPEWADIEEQTLDRGTELLNLLLYLNECRDEAIEPSLEDYLTEFLLVEDDEFQDEHQIYEPVIANQILVESSPEEVQKVASKLSEDAELRDIFYPMMTFFQNTQPSTSDEELVAQNAVDKGFDMAVYSILVEFNKD